LIFLQNNISSLAKTVKEGHFMKQLTSGIKSKILFILFTDPHSAILLNSVHESSPFYSKEKEQDHSCSLII